MPVLAANAVLTYVDLRGRSAIYFGSEDLIGKIPLLMPLDSRLYSPET